MYADVAVAEGSMNGEMDTAAEETVAWNGMRNIATVIAAMID